MNGAFTNVINWLRIPRSHFGSWAGLTPRSDALVEAGHGDTQGRTPYENIKRLERCIYKPRMRPAADARRNALLDSASEPPKGA